MFLECQKHSIAFPAKNDVLKQYLARTIFTGTLVDINKHYKLQFGAFTELSNGDLPHTAPAICLALTCNFQGSYKFLSLNTAHRIKCKQCIAYPMLPSIIRQVEALVCCDCMPHNICFAIEMVISLAIFSKLTTIQEC